MQRPTEGGKAMAHDSSENGALFLDYLNAPDVAALALTDTEILTPVEAGLRRAGARANGDRAAHASRARTRDFAATSTCCGAMSRRSRSPASRSSATTSTTISAACPPRWACSTCSIRRRDSRLRSSMPRGSPTCAPARSPRSAPSISRARSSRVLGHIGARGTAYWNVRLLDACSTSTKSACTRGGRRAATPSRARLRTRPRQARRRDRRLGIVRARRRHRGRGVAPAQARAAAARPHGSSRGAFVVPYGTMSAVELSLTDIMDKLVVDDWGQCKAGQFGSLRAHVDAGKLTARDAARGAGRDRRRPQAGTRARRRDDPVLASRPVAVRHRARRTRCCRRRSAWVSGSAALCLNR